MRESAQSLPEIRGVSGWQLLAKLTDKIPDEMLETFKGCESPIEQMFACALGLSLQAIPEANRPKFFIQVPIGKYRADMVLEDKEAGLKLVIECDGAAFHQDRERDDKRTKAIERMGYSVYRISGVDIHHNPLAEAKQLLDMYGYFEGPLTAALRRSA